MCTEQEVLARTDCLPLGAYIVLNMWQPDVSAVENTCFG